jgi:hypothetical protein
LADYTPLFIRDILVTSESHVNRLTFESYGVRVSLECENPSLLDKALRLSEKALLGRLEFIENPSSELGYRFGFDLKGDTYYLFQNGEQTNHTTSEFVFFKYFNSMLRITVAENTVQNVFVHAGVIGWKGRAVLFPGRSFKGKTTLVAELINRDAEYYSDEYAVIRTDGRVEPFARDLSLRGIVYEYDEVEVPPILLGAKTGTAPLSVGAVVITEFREDACWQPKRLTTGEGILETLPHTIPIRAGTEMSLKILNLAFTNAIIAKSYRGDVKRDAVAILAFLDKHLN